MGQLIIAQSSTLSRRICSLTRDLSKPKKKKKIGYVPIHVIIFLRRMYGSASYLKNYKS